VNEFFFKLGNNISIQKYYKKKHITCKIVYILVYIFAMWESDAENYLLMLVLTI